MFSYTAKLLLAIAFIAVSLCACFTYLHLNYTSEQARHDLESQNFELFRKKDSLALARRLDAMTADGRWQCIVGIKGETIFFRSDDENCRGQFLSRKITIGSRLDGFYVTMILVPPVYFLIFLVSLNLALVGLVAGTVVLVRRHHEENAYLIHQLFESSRQLAHDIRSPISAINLVTQAAGIKGEAKEVLESSISRLNSMASDLMSRSKRYKSIISGQNLLLQNRCSSNEIVSVTALIVDEFRHILKGRNIDLVLSETIEDKSALVSGSAVELQRIISNLINNSVEAMEKDGLIAISIAHPIRENLKIIVRDNGPGFNNQILKKLGKRFVTFGKTTGNGFGLFYAKRTVLSWGGTINFGNDREGAFVELNLKQA